MKKLAITTALVSSVLILGAWCPKEARDPQSALRIESQPLQLTVEPPAPAVEVEAAPEPKQTPAVPVTVPETPVLAEGEQPLPTSWLRCLDNYGQYFETDSGSLPVEEQGRCTVVER